MRALTFLLDALIITAIISLVRSVYMTGKENAEKRKIGKKT